MSRENKDLRSDLSWKVGCPHLYRKKAVSLLYREITRPLSRTSFFTSRYLYREGVSPSIQGSGEGETKQEDINPVFLYERSEYLTLS